MKASQLAQYLRQIADSFEKEPEAEVGRWYFMAGTVESKEKLLAIARVLPRPFHKSFTDESIQLRCEFGGDSYSEQLVVMVDAERKTACEIVEPARPAVYRCDPLLSPEEEAQVGA